MLYTQVQIIAKRTIEFLKTQIRASMSLVTDSFWYWDIGALVFAGEDTTLSVSGKNYRTSVHLIKNDYEVYKFSYLNQSDLC